jgi:RNA polymerase sigma-70 factor (ECF subfamily)
MTEADVALLRLVTGARSGDATAAHRLVEVLHPLVLRIVRRHRSARAGDDDLAQEVFLKLFQQLDRYESRDGIPFEHWASRVAVRTCLDILRAERRRPEARWSDLDPEELGWLDYLLGSQPAPSDGTDASALELLQRLLAQLSPADQLVLRLLDLEQKSVREISQLTGWSRPGVKVRAFRARQRLRRLARTISEERAHE